MVEFCIFTHDLLPYVRGYVVYIGGGGRCLMDVYARVCLLFEPHFYCHVVLKFVRARVRSSSIVKSLTALF